MEWRTRMASSFPGRICDPPLLDDLEEIELANGQWDFILKSKKNSEINVDSFSSSSEDDIFDGVGGTARRAVPIGCSKEKLASYVEFGIQRYNKQMDKKFKLVGIEEASAETLAYYIPFTAVENDNDEPRVFQLLVKSGIAVTPEV